MHSKQKGVIGVWAVGLDLVKKGYPVFVELSDLSKTDLIVLVDNKPIKIQVKCCSVQNEVVNISTKKWGPGYNYNYTKDDFDIFAIYVTDLDLCCYISNAVLDSHRSCFSLRTSNAVNNQVNNTHPISDYTDFLRAIK